jgi:MYXO-CTERM domain-containing protein
MKFTRSWAAWLVVPVAVMTGSPARAARTAADEAADDAALARIAPVHTRDLCARAPGRKHCMAKVVTDEGGNTLRPLDGAAPQGLAPADLHAAYSLPMTGGDGRTVAVIDAFDAPNAESDLATYRSQFGLPPCTSASGCFTKVDENGGTNYPPTDGQGTNGWEGEIMLDIEMISAVCPDCHILLVEAPSDSASFAPSLATAGKMGASAISNSYGSNEDESVTQQESSYNQPALVTASAGDSGYGAEYPATSAYVLAVGGTSLTPSSSSRGWAETTWAYNNGGGTGSGCSGFITKPSYQTDGACPNRMESDVSAVADPQTGVATYDQGWEVVGGTSAASPIVASTFTLLGLTKVGPGFPYANPQAFNDITSGSNDPQGGAGCGNNYECVAGPGYDGPTGWGTPNGAVLATLGTTTQTSDDAGAPSTSSSSGSSGGTTPPTTDAGSPSGSSGGGSSGGSAPTGGGSSSTSSGSSGGSSSTSGGAPVSGSSSGGFTGSAPTGSSGSSNSGGSSGSSGFSSSGDEDAGTSGFGNSYSGGVPNGLTQGSQTGCSVAAPGSSTPGDLLGWSSLYVLGAAFAHRRRRADRCA